MVVACSLVHCQRIPVADDADGRLLQVFAAGRDKACVLQTAVEVVHKFDSVLRRKGIAQFHECIRRIGVSKSVPGRDELSVPVDAASSSSECPIDKVVEIPDRPV